MIARSDERLEHMVAVRLTEEERAQLDEMSRAQLRPVSNFLRTLIKKEYDRFQATNSQAAQAEQ